MDEYYKLTKEDIQIIADYINNEDFDELIDFIENGICIVAGIHTQHYLEKIVRIYGVDALLKSCNTCARNTNCKPLFALHVCGKGYIKWEEKV